MENQIRELLRDIAEDIPPQREVPPTLRPRARRRIAATVGVTAVLVGALALGGLVAVRSITESSPVPADPGPTVELPDDPGAWQRIVLPGGPPGCDDFGCLVRSVAAGDAGLVAVGSRFTESSEGFVGWSSPDGVSWHQIEGVGASQEAEGIAAAGPGFVAARRDGIFASTDGVSWDRVHSDPAGDGYLSVTAGGPGVVAIGSSNRAWYSSDGLTWAPTADVYPGDGKTRQVSMTEVEAGAGRLVATGYGERLAIWVSSDGMSWRDVPIDGEVFSLSCRITDVAGGPNGFVAVGWCGDPGRETDYLIWRSDDGVNWSRVGGDGFDGGAPPYLAVGAGPTGFIAVDGQTVWTSVDGESWTRVPWPAFQGAVATDVTAWGSRLVVVGYTEDGRNLVWISGPQQ